MAYKQPGQTYQYRAGQLHNMMDLNIDERLHPGAMGGPYSAMRGFSLTQALHSTKRELERDKGNNYWQQYVSTPPSTHMKGSIPG